MNKNKSKDLTLNLKQGYFFEKQNENYLSFLKIIFDSSARTLFTSVMLLEIFPFGFIDLQFGGSAITLQATLSFLFFSGGGGFPHAFSKGLNS